jgi:quercetin dioxygenase-like cupin family protein
MEALTVNFFFNDEVPWEELGDGIRRKIVGHTPHLMSVLIEFDKGAIGTPHAHDAHDQIAYVLQGSFEANINGEVRVIRAGDSFIAPRTHMHGVVALEDKSRLLDQFSPRREDYLSA